MKCSLVIYYLLFPLMILGISKQAASNTFRINSLDDLRAGPIINFDAKQCKKQLPNDLDNLKKHLQPTDTERKIQQYYLMTSMGIDYKYFLSNNRELLTWLNTPLLNSEGIIKTLTKKLADSFINSLEDTREEVEKDTANAIDFFFFILISTEIESSEVYTAFPSYKLLSTDQLEKNSQSVINLLINNILYDNSLSQLDSASTAKFLHKKLGLPQDTYQTFRNDFFINNTLFNEKDTALRQVATFISYMIIRHQYDGLVKELTTRESCINDSRESCYSQDNPVERLMEKASERLIVTMTDWLATPEHVQPCFNAGCDSWVWYAWAKLRVNPVQKIHATYRSGGMTYWFQLASRDQTEAREVISLFKAYMKNDACRKYGGL